MSVKQRRQSSDPITSRRAEERRNRLWYRHRLRVKDYEALFRAQNGCCAICGREIRSYQEAKSPRQACVDHDHQTGKVRALLCPSCNRGLGQFSDSPRLLRKAATYLEYHS